MTLSGQFLALSFGRGSGKEIGEDTHPFSYLKKEPARRMILECWECGGVLPGFVFCLFTSCPWIQWGSSDGDLRRTRNPYVANQAIEVQWGLTDTPAPALSSVLTTPHFIDEEPGPRTLLPRSHNWHAADVAV